MPDDKKMDEVIDKTDADNTDKVVDKTDQVIIDKNTKATDNINEAALELQNLLEEKGFDSLEDLTEALAEADNIKEVIGDKDLEEIIKKSNTLEKYEAHWAKQKDQKLQEDEEPEDTIARKDREIEDLRRAASFKDQQVAEAKAVKQEIANFNETVSSEVDNAAGVSKEHRAFVSKLLGVNNPFNTVNIAKPADVKKMARAGIAEFKNIEKQIGDQAVRDYLAGKKALPDITDTDTAIVQEKPKIKTLEDAKNAMLKMAETGQLPGIGR